MADEEAPGDRAVLGCEAVEGRNVVVVRQPVCVRLNRTAAAQLARIAAGFEQDHAPAGFSQPGGQRASAGAGTDDEVFAVRRV